MKNTKKKNILVTVELDSRQLWYAPVRQVMSDAAADRAKGIVCWIRTGNAMVQEPDDEELFLALHACAYQVHRCDRSKSHTRGCQTEWERRWRTIRDHIVEQNMGLVYAMLSRYRRALPSSQEPRAMPDDELVSDAQLALVNAVVRFNPTRGFRFSTYACSAIAHSLMYRGKVENRRRRWFPVQHDETLDTPVFPDDPNQELYAERLHAALDSNSAELTDLESEILDQRFPFDSRKRMTLRELGRAMGVSKERVRQIQNRALRKLRTALQSDPILQ